jgi:hypothetical protein
MRLVEHARMRAQLPDMCGLAVFLVEFRRVGAVAVSQRFGNRILAAGDPDDVNVVAHHTVGGDPEAVLPGVVIKQFAIPKMIRVIQKYIEAADTTLSNMMRKTWADNPSHSRHGDLCGHPHEDRSSNDKGQEEFVEIDVGKARPMNLEAVPRILASRSR